MAIQVGFGTYNITPPLGMRMAGYAQREGVAEDVHDPLTARSVVFAQGSASSALITIDTCMLPADVMDAAAARVEQRTGIPADSVVAASIHTHSGPALREEGAYRDLLPDLMASAAELAWKRRTATGLIYGSGTAAGLCVNRREPGGPVDEEFAYLRTRAADGGVLFSFPLHGVVLGSNNLSLSADYIGYARAAIERGRSGRTAVFVAGASGEMNPLTPSVKQSLAEHGDAWYTDDPLTGIYDRTSGTFAEAQTLGRRLAQAVMGVGGEPVSTPDAPRSQSWTVNLGNATRVEVRIRCIRIGNLAILALPGEHFIDTGLRLRRMLRDAGLRPIVLTHAGQLSYVPPTEAFAEGGYEVELARRKGLSSDAQTRIIESVRREIVGG